MNRRACLAALLLALPALAQSQEDRRDECRRIRQRLQDIESARRAGYTARRGRQLRAQREKLDEQRRIKCR